MFSALHDANIIIINFLRPLIPLASGYTTWSEVKGLCADEKHICNEKGNNKSINSKNVNNKLQLFTKVYIIWMKTT